MLHRSFDLQLPYRSVAYLRMSSDLQNTRSPDQQLDEITRRISMRNLPWQIVETFRDQGLSGRYVRKRPAYSEMLRKIATRQLEADLAARWCVRRSLDDLTR